MESLLWKGFNHNTPKQNDRLEKKTLLQAGQRNENGQSTGFARAENIVENTEGFKERRRGVTAKLRILF